MISFILQILVFISLGLIVYLLAKAAPRVGNEPPSQQANPFDKLMARVPMARIDENINSFLSKFLRKFKVVIMKVDNFINHRLGKLTKKNGNGTNGDKPSV